jgi:alpha-amylase
MKKNCPKPVVVLAIFISLVSFLPCPTTAQSALQKDSTYKHPAWSEQSNIYEVNLRQYTASSSIKDFEKSLPRLHRMGVQILWFMPINPIGLKGRKMSEQDLGSYYSVSNYRELNSEFGTMKDWKQLVKMAHSMGFKVIIDWVPNHTSPDNPWMTTHPDFYKHDANGNTVYDADYSDTRNLDYSNRELRDTMIADMKFWIKETNIDGFRCDHVDPMPLDFWQQCIDSLKKLKDVFMLAESENPAFHTVGFDETYAWSVMEAFTRFCAGKETLPQVDSLVNYDIERFPKNAYRMYFTTNHDWNSWEGTEFEKYGDAYKPLAVFTQTMYQSIPMIYSGQEIPNKKRLKFFVKDPIQWTQYKMAPFYSLLLHLRKKDPALAANASYKKLETANDMAIFAYAREKAGHKIVVILNLSKEPQTFTIDDPSVIGNPLNVFTGKREFIKKSHVFRMKPWDYFVYEFE